MNEILSNYSQEEIEQLALKQIESENFENQNLKIKKIDKEYKKHNVKAVTKALTNASIIFMCSYIVMNSNVNMADLKMEDIVTSANDIMYNYSLLFGDQSEFVMGLYSKVFEGLSKIISELGLIGFILSIKAVKFVKSITQDTIKGIKMKQELETLKDIVEKEKLYETNKTK